VSSTPRILLAAALCAAASSCEKPEGPKPPAGQEPALFPSQAATDFSRPYLTQERMQGLLAALQERPDLSGPPGQGNAWTPDSGTSRERIDALNAFARKHGFKDLRDYGLVLTRVWIARMRIELEDGLKRMPDGAGDEDPAAKTRRMAIETLSTPDPARKLSKEDLEMVRKYWTEIGRSLGR